MVLVAEIEHLRAAAAAMLLQRRSLHA